MQNFNNIIAFEPLKIFKTMSTQPAEPLEWEIRISLNKQSSKIKFHNLFQFYHLEPKCAHLTNALHSHIIYPQPLNSPYSQKKHMIRFQLSFCKPHKFSVIDRLFIPSSFPPIHPQKTYAKKKFNFTNKTNRNPKPKITSDFFIQFFNTTRK
ncbi:hypothetical protein ACKWTF_000979 [Chironomus riparius]